MGQFRRFGVVFSQFLVQVYVITRFCFFIRFFYYYLCRVQFSIDIVVVVWGFGIDTWLEGLAKRFLFFFQECAGRRSLGDFGGWVIFIRFIFQTRKWRFEELVVVFFVQAVLSRSSGLFVCGQFLVFRRAASVSGYIRVFSGIRAVFC